MENKDLINDYLNSCFLDLSNLSYKISELTDSSFIICIIKKNDCFYKYNEVKEILSGSFVHTFEDSIYTLDLKASKTSKDNEFKINYKIERCED